MTAVTKISPVRSYSGVWTSPRARSLGPVLDSWNTLIGKYCQTQPNDLPYWYNERATLSMVAAAAWASGGIALEEYSSPKRAGPRGDVGNGRADLWIRVGSLELGLEAKQAWPTIVGAQRQDCVRGAMAEAVRDARCLPYSAAPQRAGVVFAVPDVAPKHFDAFAALEVVHQIRKTPHDFAAWWFSPPPWPRSPITSYRYPGVVLLGRFVSRRRA